MTGPSLGSIDELVARALALRSGTLRSGALRSGTLRAATPGVVTPDAGTQEARVTPPAPVTSRDGPVEGAPAPRLRTLIGIAGEPGGGKSTVAAAVAEGLTRLGVTAQVVPMDGFHLAGSTLTRLGRLERKGAIDTFDAEGYLALLRRLAGARETVWAPEYVRGVEESIGGSIEIDPTVEVVVSEGNYLLADLAPWPEVQRVFDEVWFVDTPAESRRDWLVARHVRFGMTPEAAVAWAGGPDEANARLVRSTRPRADAVVDAARLWPA